MVDVDGVVEEAKDAVAVVLVVLRRVDAALRRDRVRAPRRVVDAEHRDAVAHLGERRGRGASREPRPDDDHVELPAVRRIDELQIEHKDLDVSGVDP